MRLHLTNSNNRNILLHINDSLNSQHIEKILGIPNNSIVIKDKEIFWKSGEKLVSGINIEHYLAKDNKASINNTYKSKDKIYAKNNDHTLSHTLQKPGWQCEILSGINMGETLCFKLNSRAIFGNSQKADIRINNISQNQDILFTFPSCGKKILIDRIDNNMKVLINGDLIDKSYELSEYDVIEFAGIVITFYKYISTEQQHPHKSYIFNRPPKLYNKKIPEISILPPKDKPQKSRPAPIAWASYIVPIIFTLIITIISGRFAMILLVFSAPIAAAINWFFNWKKNTKEYQKLFKEWEENNAHIKKQLIDYKYSILRQNWQQHPSFICLYSAVTTISSELWKERLASSSALQIRCGIGKTWIPISIGSNVTSKFIALADMEIENSHIALSSTPIILDLNSGVLGCSGNSEILYNLVGWLIVQLAVKYSPEDLKIMLLSPKGEAKYWEWVRWIPHIQRNLDCDISEPTFFIANTWNSVTNMVAYINKLIKIRSENPVGDRYAVVAIFDSAITIRDIPGAVNLLEISIKYNIYIVALANKATDLPQECTTQIDIVNPSIPEATVTTQNRFYKNITIDTISFDLLEKISRQLAPIVHRGYSQNKDTLPKSIKFHELLSFDSFNPKSEFTNFGNIDEFYKPNIKILLGKSHRKKYEIDLLKYGSHIMIGGTTGSGKSEFLQTVTLYLALNNSANRISFIFIDYKGGATFREFAQLPQTVGMVNDLNTKETSRLLKSLEAEIIRRKTALSNIDAKDISTAWQENPQQCISKNLTHLFLIIDEFAELKQSLPDLMAEINRIARIGRSLGIHLILSTQKPGGNISSEIQANISLRIAFRVADKIDSQEIIGIDKAAHISKDTPGRGIIRTGELEAAQEFQSPKVHYSDYYNYDNEDNKIFDVSWEKLSIPLSENIIDTKHITQKKTSNSTKNIQNNLAHLISDIKLEHNKFFTPNNFIPHHPPLPETLKPKISLNNKYIHLGTLDIPQQQKQIQLNWKFESSFIIIGAKNSGKTSILKTILNQIITQYTEQEIHLHIANFGTNNFTTWQNYPHLGNLLHRGENSRILKLVNYLYEQFKIRTKNIAKHQKQFIKKLPHILLLIDNFEQIATELTPENFIELREKITTIASEGPKTGITLIITAEPQILQDNRMLTQISQKIILNLPDPHQRRLLGINYDTTYKPKPGRGNYISQNTPNRYRNTANIHRNSPTNTRKYIKK